MYAYVHLWATQSMNQDFKFNTAQSSGESLRPNCHTSLES